MSDFFVPDEDVRKYCEKQKKSSEPPVQVPEVDSCVPRSAITREDDPEGQYLFRDLVYSLLKKILYSITDLTSVCFYVPHELHLFRNTY